MNHLEEKYQDLKNRLGAYGSVLVAYSGGIDSALLLYVAGGVLGDHALGVIGDSPSLARRELKEARQFAEKIGVRLREVKVCEMEDPHYTGNPSNRCYYCKAELYRKLMEIADEEKLAVIANGANVDDLQDYRPGQQAADEFRIVSPLRDAGFTKQDIRDLARRLDLVLWDKPASPCLASRIPYGEAISPEKLAQIEAAEDFLHSLGIRQLRVRHFGRQAIIETNQADFSLLEEHRQSIHDRFREIGFSEVEKRTFRSGALNDVLQET